MSFVSAYKDGRVLLKVYVQPRSSRNRIVGLHGDAIKLAITAPPVDGKANVAVIKFLASFFGVRKMDLEIKNGLQSRRKSVLIARLSSDEVEAGVKQSFA
jgi:uncharacterized protein (TIGR00251 family)